MADITVTAARVAPIFPKDAEIYDMIAAETLTAGQPVYIDGTTGKVKYADANDAARDELHGIALNGARAGQAVAVLKRGHVYGYTLAGNYGSKAYVSDTAGVLADAAGTASLPVGIVVPLSDASISKALYVDVAWK